MQNILQQQQESSLLEKEKLEERQEKMRVEKHKQQQLVAAANSSRVVEFDKDLPRVSELAKKPVLPARQPDHGGRAALAAKGVGKSPFHIAPKPAKNNAYGKPGGGLITKGAPVLRGGKPGGGA